MAETFLGAYIVHWMYSHNGCGWEVVGPIEKTGWLSCVSLYPSGWRMKVKNTCENVKALINQVSAWTNQIPTDPTSLNLDKQTICLLSEYPVSCRQLEQLIP